MTRLGLGCWLFTVLMVLALVALSLVVLLW